MPCDPEDCECYDGKTILQNLPCGGCDKCQKRHEQWSTFAEIDDVVPLLSKAYNASSICQMSEPVGSKIVQEEADEFMPQCASQPKDKDFEPPAQKQKSFTTVKKSWWTVCKLYVYVSMLLGIIFSSVLGLQTAVCNGIPQIAPLYACTVNRLTELLRNFHCKSNTLNPAMNKEVCDNPGGITLRPDWEKK